MLDYWKFHNDWQYSKDSYCTENQMKTLNPKINWSYEQVWSVYCQYYDKYVFLMTHNGPWLIISNLLKKKYNLGLWKPNFTLDNGGSSAGCVIIPCSKTSYNTSSGGCRWSLSWDSSYLWCINAVIGDRLPFNANTCVLWHIQGTGTTLPWKQNYVFFTTVSLFCFVLVHTE